MKYLKLFESANKYKIGDYVMTLNNLVDDDAQRIPPNKRILEIITILSYNYRCKLLFCPSDKELIYSLTDQNIIRKVEEWEINAKKYNL